MDEVKAEREIQSSIQQINTSIDTILSSSTNYFPPFISCVLDILFELRNKLTVNVGNISSCAVISNVQPLGIVLLEDQLIVQNSDEVRRTKRGRHDGLSISKDMATWIELARLYKSVDEYDVLLGIFTNKIGTQEVTKKAVQAESRCDYQKARAYYEEALSTTDWPSDHEPLEAEIDLWDDCRLKCLNNLTQWKELENITMLTIEGDLSKVWDDTFNQEHYLPYIMRSKVKLMLHGDEDQQTLLDFVDAAMKNPEQKSLLESRYCEYLALMYMWQQDYDRARHYTKMTQDKFLQEWCSTDVLILSSRTSRLQTLQPLVELQEFLGFMSQESNFTSNTSSTQLLTKWERRNPHVILDCVDVWDDIVTNRNVYLDHIGQKLTTVQSADSMETDDEDLFLSSKVKLKLLMAESSTTQNNFKLSLNILAETKKQCKELDGISMLLWSHLYTLTHHKKAFQGTDCSDDMFKSILSTRDILGKYEKSDLLKKHAGLGRRHFVLSGQSYQLLATAVTAINNLNDLNDENQQSLKKLTGHSKPKEIADVLVHNGYEQINKCLDFVGRSTSECNYGMDQAYLMVAKYCDTFLRQEEDEEITLSKTDSDTFTSKTIACLLNAMKLNCTEARQRFPRLLQLVEMYPNNVDQFKVKCREVPSWMFIMWIGQMVALLDKPEAAAIHDVIIDIASTYPQAVTYPFKLSREGYKFGNTKQDKNNMAVVQKLDDLLNDSLVSKFVSALEQFSQPDQLFKDWYEDTKLLISKKENKKQIVTEFSSMFKMIFDHSSISSSSSRQSVDTSQGLSQVSQSSMVETGNYIRKFGARFKKDVESLFGKDGQKLASMTLKEFQQNFSKIFKEIEVEVKKTTLVPPKSLKDYCVWLADFNASIQGRRLEIPGQYDGSSKPMPEYHVKVVGFDPRVLVMTSIRKPKRITIRGNDEKEYLYLVKGGEDLRQDQRIEQLFHLMNQVFEKNPACRHRKLYVRTYQVIPMTTRVGLIEWVKNTMPLKEFLRGSLTDRENIDDKKHGPAALHSEWIKKLLPKDNQFRQYCQMYKTYSKTETIKEFRNKESRVPWDLMRRSFQQMSTSPEAFHVLRVNCAVSNSVMSMCQYILGIGDRHLSNSMIDLNTGQMVGIDFGHAFGSATQFLPIPELIPFRLTRQIRNLMMPLQEKGLMESTMIHSLRALREDYDLLLSTMDIFIKEPSLDWLINAEKQKQAMSEESIEDVEETEGDISWFPKQKVKYVMRKMKGHNPRLITRDELEMGKKRLPAFTEAFKAFENVVLGDVKDNVRAELPNTGLSVEQQVAALIDQATDPNILGRTYGGWEPWM